MEFTDMQKAIIALKNTDGIGNAKAKAVIDALGEHIALIAADAEEIKQELTWHLGDALYRKLRDTAAKYDYSALARDVERYGADIAVYSDVDFPFMLKQIDDCPLVLYLRGDRELLNSPAIAVVGTRYPTKYGVRVTEDFVSVLAQEFTVVSGLAMGIDAMAHRTALHHGKTVAVLGNGLDKVYPSENYRLYADIAENGLIITEYDFGTLPNAYNFPARNRIITGVSRGVLVTEAGERSGTMITVNCALSQGRDVYVVPGSIYNNMSVGCNRLIKESQACAVTSVDDIFEDIGYIRKKKEEDKTPMTKEEKAIVDVLSKGETHFEEILAQTGLTVPKLNSLLVKMSVKGMINKCNNNYWSM